MSTAPTSTASPTMGVRSPASRLAIGTPRVRTPTRRNGTPPRRCATSCSAIFASRRPSPSASHRRVSGSFMGRPRASLVAIGEGGRTIDPSSGRSGRIVATLPPPCKRTGRPSTGHATRPVFSSSHETHRMGASAIPHDPEVSPAMKIILASPRGFCAGVNMAIESLERALDFFGAPLYVYHEIVHNKYVVERFLRRGVVFVESLEEVPPGFPLLYSAHGVSPQIREQARQRKLVAIDATCPLVTKVHLEAVKYAREGYTIILIGHEGHDEVIGTMGEAPDRMILVETAEDAERLEVADPSK